MELEWIMMEIPKSVRGHTSKNITHHADTDCSSQSGSFNVAHLTFDKETSDLRMKKTLMSPEVGWD